MSNILRIALCSSGESKDLTGLVNGDDQETVIDGKEKTITMTGPLSEIYTKALQLVYAKPEETDGFVAAESQANDVFMQVAHAKAMAVMNSAEIDKNKLSNGYTPLNNVYVYSAKADDFSTYNTITAANDLVNRMINDPSAEACIIVDGGEEGSGAYNSLVPNENQPSLVAPTVKLATETLCKAIGVNLYYSFEAFVIALQKK